MSTEVTPVRIIPKLGLTKSSYTMNEPLGTYPSKKNSGPEPRPVVEPNYIKITFVSSK